MSTPRDFLRPPAPEPFTAPDPIDAFAAALADVEEEPSFDNVRLLR